MRALLATLIGMSVLPSASSISMDHAHPGSKAAAPKNPGNKSKTAVAKKVHGNSKPPVVKSARASPRAVEDKKAHGDAGAAVVSDRAEVAKGRSPSLGEDVVVMGGVPVYDYRAGLRQSRKISQSPDATPRETVGDWIVWFKDSMTEERIEALCLHAFVACTDHGNCRNGNSGHPGLAFLVCHCTGDQLNASLTQVAEEATFAVHDAPVSITDSHLDFSRHLFDSGGGRAATWGLNRIGKDSAPAAGFGVHAYVLDTGVRTTHSQFTGRAIPTIESLGHIKKCGCQETMCANDTHGHGTHCAGTIGGITFGVAPQVRVHSVKVLDNDGYGYTSWSIAAEGWILSNGMRPAVVSMSLGGPGNNNAEKAAIDALFYDGVAVVVAAGNEEDSACNYNPAFIPNAITVGSTDSTDSLSWFSNFGNCVDILAPGSSVQSAGKESDTQSSWMSGTSMACPHVSGAVAILYSLSHAMTPTEIVNELLARALDGAIAGLGGTGAPNKLLQVDLLSASA